MRTDATPRVLWLTKGLGPGGAEKLLVALATATAPSEVHYEAAYLLPWKQHLVPDLERAGVRTHLLDGRRTFDLRWAWRLRRLLRAGRFDVLHAHSPVPAAIARLVVRSIARRHRPLMVSTEHNVWPAFARSTRVLTRMTAGLDDHRFTVSESARVSLPRSLAAGTTTLIHGIDLDRARASLARRDEVRAELAIDPSAVVVCTLANLRADKDHSTLIAAASIVSSAQPDVRFIAAGQGPLETEVRALLDAARLPSFTFLGYRDDAVDLLAAADVLAVSSRREGLPVAVMEALALGRPVVSTTVGGIPELVRDGVEGLLVPPGDPRALARALLRLVTDAELRQRFAEAAAQRAELVDVGRAASALAATYARLLGGRP